jgi:hypothetical protein
MRNVYISYMEIQLSNVVPVAFQPTNEIPRSVREEHCTQVRIQLRVLEHGLGCVRTARAREEGHGGGDEVAA